MKNKPKEKEIVRKLVDLDTGELFEIYEGDKVSIIKEQQKEAIQKSIHNKELQEDVKEWTTGLGGFVFVLYKYCDDILKSQPNLIPSDITKLFYLATFVNYDGYLICNEGFVNRATMQKMLNMSREKFTNFYNKLKKAEIFIQDINKNIKINSDFFNKGELGMEIKKNYNYTRIYINTIRYLFENVPQNKHKQLGNYFRIIPYIHRQQNVLCWNPESKQDQIQLMHVKDLQEILGYHENSVRRFIKDMLSTRLDNGQAILGFFRTQYDEGKSYVIVNPRVIYGGNFDLSGGRDAVIRWF